MRTEPMRTEPMRTLPVLAAALLLPLTACSPGEDNDSQELTVLAASSLTEVFTDLADEFERTHDGVEVTFSFGSSTTLAEQAVDGAPGDVLATADEKAMSAAVDGAAVDGEPQQFATNSMVLVVPADNPARIRSFADLEKADWVRCADDVPCGRVAASLIEDNGFTGEPVSLEVDVKSVLAKVTSGEAEAGFVYASDATAAGAAVRVIGIPHADEEVPTYFIAPLGAGDEDLSADWVDLVSSEKGQQALTDAGFTVRRVG
jgi:molybdate transport system substrate-binding protein